MNANTQPNDENPADGRSASNGGLAQKTCNGVLSRHFALGQEGNPTEVHMAEFTDGCIGIALITKRNEFEPLCTEIYLSARTFGLLSDAILRAAHYPEIWEPAN